MATAKENLFDVRGKVLQFRPGISPSLVDKFINAKVREVLDRRTYWSDLIKRGSLGVPDGVSEGLVNVTTGSPVVTGFVTNWPVADVAGTRIRDGIFETGNQEVFPATMQGITEDSILLVDQEGVQEVVYVNQVTANSFWAVFAQQHNQDCTVLRSSLAGRQFRLGTNSPIYTVMAVTATDSLLLQQNWEGANFVGGQYTILKMYFTVVPNIRKFMDDCIVDTQQGIPIFTNVGLRQVNWQDPQRTAGGDPQAFVDLGANDNGLSIFELWPAQTVRRQLAYSVYTDWPVLANDTDRLPWFMNPDIFFYGALSDALRFRAGKDDPFHDKVSANHYEGKFLALLNNAMNADESKMQQDYDATSPIGLGGGPGTVFFQRHVSGYGGGDWGRDFGY